MREHEIFRVGMRIVGVFFLGWFVVRLPDLIMQIWNFFGGLIFVVSNNAEVPPGAPGDLVGGIVGELLRLFATCAPGIVAWYLIFRGNGLFRRVYPGSVTASASA